ncbi:MAG: RagB/SusD family nutrient uptake outer membrane protein [Chryseobacterium sp.]|nr:MAG: RagB/SusD family nutrient uptake outer membrane protein [Chryseobacterium sp.]
MIDGTNWSNTNFANPFVAKYRNAGPRSNYFTGPPASDKADGYSPILRYADVLLIYAEAANQSEGSPSTAAYAAIDEVRVRAGLAKLPTGLSKENFDKAVLEERS